MDQYELELRRALKPQDPGSDFTARVMSRVRKGETASTDLDTDQVVQFPRLRRVFWRWAAVGAVAASLTIGVVVEQRRSERRAQQAEAELYETLLLAGEKISQARAQVTAVRLKGAVR
jgi:hypothetical protein